MTDIRTELSDAYDASTDPVQPEGIDIYTLKALVKALAGLRLAALHGRDTGAYVPCILAIKEVRKAMREAGA